MSPLDQLAIAYGFENAEEMNRLVVSVDISTPDKLAAFKKWQIEDGTKNGLTALLNNKNTDWGKADDAT